MIRKIFTAFVLLGVSSLSFGQIDLEHTYDPGLVRRVNLATSGEKYYVFDEAAQQVDLYNADHSFWKTIDLPVTSGGTVSNVYHLSEGKINSDSQIEVVYSFSYDDSGQTTYESRIIDETGNELLVVPGAQSIYLNEVEGLPEVLFADMYGSPAQTKIYSLPALNLEYTYDSDYVYRFNFAVSGEKFAFLDVTHNQVQLFNSDHTLWKTVNLPVENGATILNFKAFETKIIADEQLELMYSYYTYDGTIVYESRMVNENGEVLLSEPHARSIVLSELDGCPDEVITQGFSPEKFNKVYSVPDLTLEKAYDLGYLYRWKLDYSGETYYAHDGTTPVLYLFNADHSLRNTIDLPIPDGYELYQVTTVSEAKLNTDNHVEIAYTYHDGNNNYKGKVINDAGSVLLTETDVSSFYLNILEGLPNKLFSYLFVNGVKSSGVYDLPTVATSIENTENKKELEVAIYPNPTSDYVTVNSGDLPIDQIMIRNMEGKTVMVVDNYQEQRIDISSLNSGVYFLSGMEDGSAQLVEQLVVE